jgi:hypothetical protein
MADGIKRAPQLADLLDFLAKEAFGRTLTECHAEDKCVTCGEPAGEFKDDVSRKEYTISGMCQACQDQTFGE